MYYKLLLLLSSFFILSCASDTAEENSDQTIQSSNAIIQDKQLNITILLDLSDRIDPTINSDIPKHYQRDIEIVKYFSEIFKKDMIKRGAFLAKGKLKIIFSPKPQDPNVNILAEKLSVDLSIMNNKSKKVVFDNLTNTFNESISKIYNATISQNKWFGSDIWRFFKNDVKDYCIENDPNYRNILVILTDGYIYHEDSRDKNGNRFAYLLPQNISKFRNNQNWEAELDRQDFGLITKRNDLGNLEVLVLEVTPSPKYKNDEDIIKKVLNKWFKEMKVKRSAIFNSDLPQLSKQHIDDFIMNTI